MPAEKFRLLVKGGEPDLVDEMGERYDLDKGWVGVYTILHGKGEPFSRAITGDFQHPGYNHRFEEFYHGPEDGYIGFVSPGLVYKVDAAFAKVSQKTLEEWYIEAGIEDDSSLDYLVEIYHNAAERGNALLISIC